MTLILRQPGLLPLGQFDGVDAVTTTVKGGEVGTFVAVAVAADDAAADVDGYAAFGASRPAITTNLPATIAGPLGLIDDGNAGYGTLFGSIVGTTVGKDSYGYGSYGTQLGPHSAAASGKLTLWTKPGTYAVTLDAADTTTLTGLTLQNPTLTVGAALYATVAFGTLTPNGNASVVQNVASTDLVVGRFIEFEGNGSLVTTPASLVGAAASYTQAVFEFNPNLS